MKDFRLVLYNVSLPWHLPHLVTHPDLMCRKAGLTMGQTFMIILISSYMEKICDCYALAHTSIKVGSYGQRIMD